ncbi:hypothetical protein BpHYR1_005278 [Brachionus plicatilis]|uniref:Uncharacterized protein n=1 Tax=Brachionus plicatilis TaxID=10195 RepID=A0A3M7P1V1_BRAPC|nr:hypothetical protein BpHYR1_005278 [Brachionus plicatilis]
MDYFDTKLQDAVYCENRLDEICARVLFSLHLVYIRLKKRKYRRNSGDLQCVWICCRRNTSSITIERVCT